MKIVSFGLLQKALQMSVSNLAKMGEAETEGAEL